MGTIPRQGPTGARAPRWLLAAGIAAGLALAASGVAQRAASPLPPGAVARVGDQLIARDAWLRAVAAMASERRAELTADDQRHILDRLVDEALLVQHGLDLGLVQSDARLRSTMVSEVMLAATRRAAAPVDDAQLRAFYEANRDFFAPAARLRVAAFRLDADGARRPFEPAVPDAPLPPAKLAAYLGPALAAHATKLAPGQESEPIEAGGSRVVLRLLELQRAEAPPYEQIRDAVRTEAQRRADEAAVRELIASLRERHHVVVAEHP
ncbi:MAG TPA: peptidylprolyl isomerase [Verrucomicrobiae bacterium]|nr:peptidylprolyl isomerase [Verrucomicrobiae bacterium]